VKKVTKERSKSDSGSEGTRREMADKVVFSNTQELNIKDDYKIKQDVVIDDKLKSELYKDFGSRQSETSW